MNLYHAAQIRQWDAYTIQHEPIASIDLMERAAMQCSRWLLQHMGANRPYLICCGKGNNGGDGLAIARQLHGKGAPVAVYILEFGHLGSADFQANLQRLHDCGIQPHFIQAADAFPPAEKDTVLVDALFGTGLSRPLDGLSAALVQHLNSLGNAIVSIDVPSGLLLHTSSKDTAVVRARYTLSFQATKMAFLLAENAATVGDVVVLDIQLHSAFREVPAFELADGALVQQLYRQRPKHGHKGTFGHALLVGGSYGRVGAMVLATRAALRSGLGLCTTLVPACGYTILQTTAPEAMCITEPAVERLEELHIETGGFDAVGVGPGLGTHPNTQQAFARWLVRQQGPLIIDADGLNCLAQTPSLLDRLPAGTILTPHPREFERLFGSSDDEFARVAKAQATAVRYNCVIVLKGHHTLVCAPEGPACFNSTGNAGMATGGSGDVLTGIITGLLAQGYDPRSAAVLGVYLHGWAGDKAARERSQEALVAGDITEQLGAAFLSLQTPVAAGR